MKTIGLIGGMSCESTAHYYTRLNEGARERLGGLHSAEILLWSVDFAPIAQMQADGDWDKAGARLGEIAARLEQAGAGLIALATNTMHKVADQIEARISVPFVHIADATAAQVKAGGFERPALLGTAFTMEERFYTDRLHAEGLKPVIPAEADRKLVHQVIYDELCKGIVRPQSRAAYEEVAVRLASAGADCLILGCTEVGMLLDDQHSPLPLFDTTLIHADAALDLALAEVEAAAA